MAMQRASSRYKQRRRGDGDRVPYTYQTRWSSLVTDCNSVKSNHNQQVGLRWSEGGKVEERKREGMCKKHGLHGGDVGTALCSANNRVKCKTSELTANEMDLIAHKYKLF